jgi:restriction system protein
MDENAQTVVKTPLLPTYAEVQMLMSIWRDKVTRASVLKLINNLWEQTGTPKDPVDWTQPDQWIDKRLVGEEKELADRVWAESKGTVNPRYLYGSYLFVGTHNLLLPDANNVYRVTDAGERFLKNDPEILRRIDAEEGIAKLLEMLALQSPAKRGDLIEEWGDYLREYSNYGTTSTIKDTLRRRLLNLVDRNLVARDGNHYSITSEGSTYASGIMPPISVKPELQLAGTIKKFNDAQLIALRERLAQMDPYRFEVLIKDLLDAMEYDNVKVTKQSGDKGVDVIADFEFGITQVREVVQVKRHLGSITRPVLDQLRGALPYHQAIRGTIITLGTFAKGCKDAALYPGAAPITLIDGDKLIELLIKHEVGVKKQSHTVYELDLNQLELAGETPPNAGQNDGEV